MKRPPTFSAVLFQLSAVLSFQTALAEAAPITHERLVVVCANLSNAAALASGGVATPLEVEAKRVSSLPATALRRKIFRLVDAINASAATSSRASRPDIFAYARDARLALIDNRQEPFSGHRQYIIDHPKKSHAVISQTVEDIKRALMQLKI